MAANYKNWVPNGMIAGLSCATGVLAACTAGTALFGKKLDPRIRTAAIAVAGVGTAACGAALAWSVMAHKKFSYDGSRQLSKEIVDGVASYVYLPKDGKGLDVGCGSGALTIACAKRNPQGTFIGIDRWGKEYASFNRELCEQNAEEEDVDNVSFEQGDAVKLDFPDEYFDAVTSNYVYHNINGVNKQELLLETLRVLKKGGCFVIHDIMSNGRYGDMEQFAEKLKSEGYERVELITTDNGMFMTKSEAKILGLSGSKILLGVK